MATIEESAIFEFYEQKFRELQERDGAYFPSKHDPEALSETAAHFSMPKEEVSRIYDEFSKHAADLEMSRVKKMPLAVRKRFFRQRAHDILRNNHDLPFFKLEGEPSGELADALDILCDEYRTMVETVADDGWTIPLSIDIRRFNDLKAHINSEVEVDDYFKQYYAGRDFRYMCRKARQQLPAGVQQQTFDECFSAYEQKQYNICRVALLTILEGLISSYNSDPCDVRVMHVCDSRATEEKNAGNSIKSLCWLSMYEFTKRLYQKSKFTEVEPTEMNRHWIEHGRTGRVDEGTDCLKLFNAISTIACIRQYDRR